MKRLLARKLGLVVAGSLLLIGAGPAGAQQAVLNCPASAQFIANPTYCAVQFAWPVGECACSGVQFMVHQCSGPAITGTTINGVPGCLMLSACEFGSGGGCQLVAKPGNPPAPPPEPQGCSSNGPGPKPPCTAAGAPVSLTTGEMYFTHHDGAAGSLSFDRTFNTVRFLNSRYGMFGPGWNSSFDKRLNLYSGVIEHRGADGFATYYQDPNSDGTFEQVRPFGTNTWFVNSGTGYLLMRRAGGQDAYSTTGALLSETDASGVTTTYARDGSGRLASVTRDGRSLTLTYIAAQTKPATLQGPTGDTLATFTYEASGRLIAVDYPESAGYRYVYDAAGRIIFVDDADGRPSESHEYDTLGRATTSEIGDGRDKLTFSYDTADKTTMTDALGRQTVYEFVTANLVKQVARITGPCDSVCGVGAEVQEWTYDVETGLVTSRKDAAGKTWTYAYDPVTLDLLSETDPLNQATTYTYDPQGRMLTRTGPDGSVTTYVQTDPGPTSITQKVTDTPLTTRTTTIQYFATADARKGKVEAITDPRGKVTTMAYSTTTGDLTSVTDPLGNSTTFAYDEAPSPPGRGLRTSVTDALGHVTKTVYEGRGRVKKVINHANTFTQFGYDAGGRRSSVTDPLGRVTRYVYDHYGRLTTVVDPMNQATRYSYDLMGNLLALTDAKNQTTTFEYDSHNRVKKTIYPGGAFETFTYDSRRQLTTMVDRKGTTTTYAYDDLGRLTGKTFSDGTPAFSYTYDVAGRMLTAVNGTDTLTWVYNLAGELLSEQSARNASTVAYQYDDGGNRVEVKLDGTVFVTYAYDDASRLTSITRGTNIFGFAYDNANRRTSMTYPNGINTAYTYDNLNRLTNLAATKTSTGTPITNFGYQYDAADNRTQKSTLDYTEDYGYDALQRLTRADRTNPGATPPNQWTWGYDAVGNRTSAQKDQEATTSTHNEKNQLLSTAGGGKMLWRGVLDEPGIATFSAASASINGQPARMLAGNVFEATLDLPAGANTVTIQAQDGSGNVSSKSYSVNVLGVPATYTYDANGNLATKTEGADAWVYTWNEMHQLTAVSKNNANQATYSYDPLGRRVERIAGTTMTGWTYDGEDILRQNATTAVVMTTTRFIHGPGTDEPMSQEDVPTGAVTYLHADGLGSITRYTSASAAITGTISYDAWGHIQTGTPAPYGFTGREWDPAAELWYYRARWYEDGDARFLSQDPIGFRAGLNLYQYVDSRPLTFIDPDGRRIVSSGTTRGPTRYNVTQTCTGRTDGGSTCPSRTTVETLPCRQSPCGAWGFDARVDLPYHLEFVDDPLSRSHESPGRTLGQHEELHASDLNEGYQPDAVESGVMTEGFKSRPACERAQGVFSSTMEFYRLRVLAQTTVDRDVAR